MEEAAQYGSQPRHFLVSGKLNGGDFSITLRTAKHVSVKDVLAYFISHGTIQTGVKCDLSIASIYEFKDEADYLDYTAE